MVHGMLRSRIYKDRDRKLEILEISVSKYEYDLLGNMYSTDNKNKSVKRGTGVIHVLTEALRGSQFVN